MGRKKAIEGQLSLFDFCFGEEISPEVKDFSEHIDTKMDKKTVIQGSFPECVNCWCSTCEHSSIGGGQPRPFGDREGMCPSCEMCIQDGKADICVIGSATEGCRYRAEKEGLTAEQEETE